MLSSREVIGDREVVKPVKQYTTLDINFRERIYKVVVDLDEPVMEVFDEPCIRRRII